jgi:hypothetical protein
VYPPLNGGRHLSKFSLNLFRSIVGFNLVLIALSWVPWFEGTATNAGAVDHLLGAFRFGGFRVDFVWLVLSTGVIALAGLSFLIEAKSSRTARVNALLCAVEVLAFCAFVYRILFTGALDFG